MKLLVTGASGFVGAHVVTQAVEAGHQVRTLSRSKLDKPNIEAITGDLLDASAVARAVEGVDVVVHLAMPKAAADDGTTILFRAMKTAGVRRLVLVSSLAVYDYQGLAQGQELDETCPLASGDRRDAYCRLKLEQESLARSSGFDLVVLRPGPIFGPGRLWTPRIGQRFGKLTVVLGGGAKVPVCYVEHVANAVVLATTRHEAIGTTLNVIDDDLPTQEQYRALLERVGVVGHAALTVRRELATRTARVTSLLLRGRVRLPNVLSIEDLEARVRPLAYSNRLAKVVLTWEPRWSVEEAVLRSAREQGGPGGNSG